MREITSIAEENYFHLHCDSYPEDGTCCFFRYADNSPPDSPVSHTIVTSNLT